MAKSSFKLSQYKPTTQSQQSQDQGGLENMLPGALGLGGSILSVEGGLPGAAIGGVSQGLGAAIKDLLQGGRHTGGFGGSVMDVLRNTGEGALYGAIPGGKLLREARYIPEVMKNPLGRTVIRGLTGGIAGGGAQEISNTGNQNQSNPLETGLMSGALNALIPMGTGFTKWVGKAPITVGSKMEEAAQGALERKGLPSKDVLQKLFGGRAIDTMGGRDLVNPEVAQLIKEGNLPIPPQGSTQGLLPAIEEHQKTVEAQLKPILESHFALTEDAQKLLKEYQYKYAPNDRKFFGQLPQKVQSLINSNSKQIDLYTLKKIQRDLGDVANWNPNLPSTPLEKFAQEAYDGIDSIIQQELGRTNNAISQSLNKQHSLLIAAKGNVRGFLKKGWPDEFRSESLGFAKRMSGTLSALRENENAMRALAAAGITGTQFLPGVPEPLKLGLQLGEAGLVAPFAFPETGTALNKVFSGIGKGLQFPSSTQTLPQKLGGRQIDIMRALQQLGVRLPGALN